VNGAVRPIERLVEGRIAKRVLIPDLMRDVDRDGFDVVDGVRLVREAA